MATYRFVIIVPDLFLQLLYSHSYSRGTSNFERFHLGLAESLCGPCVVRAHARASAAFVRASGCAAGRDAYSSAPERFGSAAFWVFREQVQQHVVRCVLWKSIVATVLSLLCCCRACAVMLCLCDRMRVSESFESLRQAGCLRPKAGSGLCECMECVCCCARCCNRTRAAIRKLNELDDHRCYIERKLFAPN